MSEPEQQQPTKTYRGNCHCGAFVFEVEAPEIVSVGDCNCSICSKRGYLWLVAKKPLTIVKDEGKLVHYSFGSKTMDHQFCGNCGTTVMGTGDGFTGVNVRTLQDLDIWGLEVKTSNGSSFGGQYVAPQYSGPEPNPPGFEDGNTYHGSCHCGAVTTAVRVNGSLEEGTYKESIFECNCSIDQRGGFVWIYPTESQLAIQGRENLSYYVFGNRVWRKAFCKTCGVFIATDQNPLTDDEVAALPEATRNFRAAKGDRRPFNLRALNGFDLKSVKPTRVDGWAHLQPPYVNP